MIIANWKMNGTRQSVTAWIEAVSKNINVNGEKPCIFCPPTCYLEHARKLIVENDNYIKLGSQIINHNIADDSLTGGISANMLRDLGVEYVLIGHSEQRALLIENNTIIANKIEKALNENLTIILCIGEDLNTKRNNTTYAFLKEQLDVLSQLNLKNEAHLGSIKIAYEPIWAIGSGMNAEKEYIEDTHAFINESLKDLFGHDKQDFYFPVLYGGSVKLENCEDIASSSNVDGLLIGGASLDPNTFSKIYNLS